MYGPIEGGIRVVQVRPREVTRRGPGSEGTPGGAVRGSDLRHLLMKSIATIIVVWTSRHDGWAAQAVRPRADHVDFHLGVRRMPVIVAIQPIPLQLDIPSSCFRENVL